jgi:hypothetical protein
MVPIVHHWIHGDFLPDAEPNNFGANFNDCATKFVT